MRVLSEVRAIVRARTRSEWLSRFADADVCLTPLLTPADVARDRHVVARRLLSRDGSAPALGEDTDVVLEEAGIDSATRAELRRGAVI